MSKSLALVFSSLLPSANKKVVRGAIGKVELVGSGPMQLDVGGLQGVLNAMRAKAKKVRNLVQESEPEEFLGYQNYPPVDPSIIDSPQFEIRESKTVIERLQEFAD